STFISVQSPSRRSKNLPSLERVYQTAKTRRENVEQQRQLAFLPIMAAAKGIYGRGRMNELNDVYSRMGEHAPHGMIELCFPEGFTNKKELPACTRIRLLTPEDIAREDL
ncbi:hypothetical protein GCK32_017211, partial [Trichostrongylus colubriformis]